MKVADSNFTAKTIIPSHLCPTAAPPLCQAEEQKPPPPKAKHKDWKADMRAKRATKKRNEKLRKLERTRAAASASLARLKLKLRDHAQEMVRTNAEENATTAPATAMATAGRSCNHH